MADVALRSDDASKMIGTSSGVVAGAGTAAAFVSEAYAIRREMRVVVGIMLAVDGRSG